MARPWINQTALKSTLAGFFRDNKAEVTHFGNTVNQCFEAYVFASMVNWYREQGWDVRFEHPDGEAKMARLKFSTRGKPNKYTFAVCSKSGLRVQVRHSLRVATQHFTGDQAHPANVVLDAAVIEDCDLSQHTTNNAVENQRLITFAEAKHMSAFAELVVGFIGMVHEMCPYRLASATKAKPQKLAPHPLPFLYVSGHLFPTARGILETMVHRNMDVTIYDYTTNLTELRPHVRLVPDTRPKKQQRRVAAKR